MLTLQGYNSSGHNSTTFGEADFNVTELTVANSGLDLDEYLNKSSTPSTDSGITSPKLDQDRSRHESSSAEDEAMLLVHRSGDGTPVIDPSPNLRLTPPSVSKKHLVILNVLFPHFKSSFCNFSGKNITVGFHEKKGHHEGLGKRIDRAKPRGCR